MADKTTIIAIAASILLVLFTIRLPRKEIPRDYRFVIYPLIMITLGMTLVSFAIPDQQKISVATQVSGLYSNIDNKVKEFNATETYKNIIVINGGSLCNRGIAPRQLESLLAEQHYNSLVIQLCLPGANHFERINILKYAEETLRKSLERETNIVLLREAFEYYDKQPLAQLQQYPDQRTIAYMNLRNGFSAISAEINTSIENNDNEKNPLGLIGTLKSLVINLTHIGLIGRYNFNIEPYEGHTPLHKAIEHEKITTKQIEEAHQLTLINPPPSLLPKWLSNHTYSSINSTVYDQVIQFIIPTLNQKALSYYFSICQTSTIKCINNDRLGHTIQKLGDDRYWYDDGNHLLEDGAKIATSWLASSIVSRDILK